LRSGLLQPAPVAPFPSQLPVNVSAVPWWSGSAWLLPHRPAERDQGQGLAVLGHWCRQLLRLGRGPRQRPQTPRAAIPPPWSAESPASWPRRAGTWRRGSANHP